MGKKSKAEAVIEMLKEGQSVASINRILGVSGSYVYMLKKKLAEGVEEVVDTVRQTAAEHTNKIKEIITDGKAQSKTTILSMTPEFAFSVSQGRQKRKEIEEAKLKEMIESWRTEADTDADVDDILDKRAATYGSFINVALFAQEMKELIRGALDEQNAGLQADHQEALDMITSKIARIIIGDSNHIDSWIDIAGYATLVADRLQGKSR
jgi:predicted transcriptional regulator